MKATHKALVTVVLLLGSCSVFLHHYEKVGDDIPMARLRVNTFQGLQPRTAPQLLGENQAQTAQNCNLKHGDLRPTKEPTEVETIGQALTCGAAGINTVAAWAAITDAKFALTIGGTSYDFALTSFAGSENWLDVVKHIQDQIISILDVSHGWTTAAAQEAFEIQYDQEDEVWRFLCWGYSLEYLATHSAGGGTDISGSGYLNGEAGTGTLGYYNSIFKWWSDNVTATERWRAYIDDVNVVESPLDENVLFVANGSKPYRMEAQVVSDAVTTNISTALMGCPAPTETPGVASQPKPVVTWTRTWGWFYEETDAEKVDANEPFSIRSATFIWTLVAGEYELEIAAGGDPGIGTTKPWAVYENTSDEMTEGTVGSLAAGEWGWALDSATTTYYTIYVNLTVGGDPDSQAADWVRANLTPEENIVGKEYELLYIPAKDAASGDAIFVMYFDAYETDGTLLGRVYPGLSEYKAQTDLQILGADVTAAQENDTTALFTLTYDTSRVSDYEIDRYYVATWVSTGNAESPPSGISDLVTVDPASDCVVSDLGLFREGATYNTDDLVLYKNQNDYYDTVYKCLQDTVTGAWVQAEWLMTRDDWQRRHEIEHIRIYRTVTGTGGTEYQYITELDVADFKKSFDAAAVVDVGGGVVGLPMTAHGLDLSGGDEISINGTTNYDGTYTVLDSTTVNQIDITKAYNAENLTTAMFLIWTSPWFLDNVEDEDAGEVLPTTNWDPPPDAILGFVAHPGRFLAGYADKTVYCSETNFPEAWPYEYELPYDIVGIGISGNMIIIVTEGWPYALVGDSPGALSTIRLPLRQSGESATSVVDADGAVIYASPDGIAAISAGSGQLLSKSHYTREQWQDLGPSSMIGAWHDEKLFMFGDEANLVFDSEATGSNLTSTNQYARCSVSDLETDLLYYVWGEKLYTFGTGDDEQQATWKSKEFLLPAKVDWTAARVKADAYHAVGTSWTSQTSAVDTWWISVCWSPELSLFCAVDFLGAANRVMTSPDGIAWTQRFSIVNNYWTSICWSPELSLFCAVAGNGYGDKVMTSPDGITWTSRTSAANIYWTSICWSPELSLFCAVAYSGSSDLVMTSPDGITWTSRTPVDKYWTSVCWSPELLLFCAVGNYSVGNRVMTSPDGITWTLRTSAADLYWTSICWSPELSLFCAVAKSGTNNRVMTSPDGITWTSRTSAADNSWTSVCWSPEILMFCAVAESGTDNRVMISSNGITWTLQESAADNSWLSVCWSPRFAIFCAVARAGTDDRVMTGSATHVILKLYANEVLVATMDVTDGEPFRLPIMRPEEQWSLQIETHDNIKEVVLGTSMSELRR